MEVWPIWLTLSTTFGRPRERSRAGIRRALPTRWRRTSSTRTRRPASSTSSPTCGTRPSLAMTMPPTVAACPRSSSPIFTPVASSKSETRISPSKTCDPSGSASISVRPTRAAMRSAMVTRPAVPPCSSTTMASSCPVACMSSRSASAFRERGTAGQADEQPVDVEGRRSRTTGKRSRRCRAPTMSSRDPRYTGSRSCPRRFRPRQHLRPGDLHRHRLDVRTRGHELGRADVGELEGAARDPRLRRLDGARRLRWPSPGAAAPPRCGPSRACPRPDPDQAQDAVADPVEGQDRPPEQAVEDPERGRDEQRGALRGTGGPAPSGPARR